MPQHLKILTNQFLADSNRWVLWLPIVSVLVSESILALLVNHRWGGVLNILAASLITYLKRANFIELCSGLVIIAITIGFTATHWRTLSVVHTVLQKCIGPSSISGRILHFENFENGPQISLEKIRLPFLVPCDIPQKMRLKLRRVQPDIPGWGSGPGRRSDPCSVAK